MWLQTVHQPSNLTKHKAQGFQNFISRLNAVTPKNICILEGTKEVHNDNVKNKHFNTLKILRENICSNICFPF